MTDFKIGDKVIVEGSELHKYHGIGTIIDLSKISATIRWIPGTCGIYARGTITKVDQND